MDRTHELLTILCQEIESQLRPSLEGIMAPVVVSYLPQVWVFETEQGACRISIGVDGRARVTSGADNDRDVTIRWRREALRQVLETRSRESIQPGDYPEVLVHTTKGRAAFNFLRKEIGL